MKSKLITACLFLGLFNAPLHALPTIERWTTEQGLEVNFVANDQIPMVDVRLTFAAGSTRDGEQPGVALLTNGLLAEGAAGKSALEIALAFENTGANFSNGSRRDMAWLSLRSLSDEAALMPSLQAFTDVLGKPDFKQPDYDRVKQQVVKSLEYSKTQPSSLVENEFYATLYGKDHPYSVPPEGTIRSVNSVKTDDLQAFHQQYYVSANGVLAIVGDVSRAQAEDIANMVASAIPKGEAAAAIPDPKPLSKKISNVSFDSKQAHIRVGQILIDRKDDDMLALRLANYIFGGGGFNSRLMKSIREREGLTYSVYSGFIPTQGKGPFYMTLQTDADQSERALALLNEEIELYLKDGPTQDEVDLAKRYLKQSFPLGIATNSDFIGYLSAMSFYDLPDDYLDTYLDRVDAIDRQQIIDAMRKHFDPDKMLTVLLMDEDSVDSVDDKKQVEK